MSTGDLKNNIRKLKAKLKIVRYEGFELGSLADGNATAFLPIYNHALVTYCPALAEHIVSRGITLLGKSDTRFVECMYKVLRDIFNYKPPINKEQFFAQGFAERKVIMCCDIIQLIIDKANKLDPVRRTSAVSKFSRPKSSESCPVVASTGVSKRGMKKSPREEPAMQQVSPTVVNELTSMPRSKLVRHTAGHSPSSAPVRHVAGTAPRSHQALPTQHILPGMSVKMQDVLYSPPGYAVAQEMETPSISKACSNFVEVVNFPRVSRPDIREDDIVEINAETSDSILQTPVRAMNFEQGAVSKEEITHIQKTLINLEEVVQNVDGVLKTTVLPIINNLQARLVLVENRMSMVETKMESIMLPDFAWSQQQSDVLKMERRGVETCNDTSTAQQTIHVTEDSLMKSSKDFSMQLNSHINSLHLDSREDMTEECSPIRQHKTDPTSGQLFSANEDTFATESEAIDRRSSTPTALLNSISNHSLHLQYADESTRERATRIRDLIQQTGQLFKTGEAATVDN